MLKTDIQYLECIINYGNKNIWIDIIKHPKPNNFANIYFSQTVYVHAHLIYNFINVP